MIPCFTAWYHLKALIKAVELGPKRDLPQTQRGQACPQDLFVPVDEAKEDAVERKGEAVPPGSGLSYFCLKM